MGARAGRHMGRVSVLREATGERLLALCATRTLAAAAAALNAGGTPRGHGYRMVGRHRGTDAQAASHGSLIAALNNPAWTIFIGTPVYNSHTDLRRADDNAGERQVAHWKRGTVLITCAGLLVAGLALASQSAVGVSSDPDPNEAKAATGSHEASDPGFSEEHIEYMEAQVPLIALIEEVAQSAPQWGVGTLEGSRIDPPKATAYLYWHGNVPSQLHAVATKAAADGIKLVTLEARYTQGELASAIDRVVSEAGAVEGLAIGANEDISGVEIQYPGADGSTTIDGVFYDSMSALRAAAEREQRASGIPITISLGSPIVLTG